MTHYITKRFLFLSLFLMLSAFFLPMAASADDRTENIDVFLVVDKSLSMEEEISAVRDYISESIVDELLIPGDNLVIIVFYGAAELLLARTVTNEISDIRDRIRLIRADGRFTDIGNALDTLGDTIPLRETEGRRKYLLLITDGIQEAPPSSRYYTADGSFNHEFLKNTKEILMEGWKIHILGIGSDTAAARIAEELAGSYSEVSETPTKEELAEKTLDLLGVVEQIGKVSLRSIGRKGSSSLKLQLMSSGYSDTRTVSLVKVTLEMPDGSEQSILEEPSGIEIKPDESVQWVLPLRFIDIPDPGSYSGTLIFSFAGDTPFTPAGSEVEYRVKGFFGNNIFWLIPVGAVILLGLIFLGLYVPRLLAGGGSVSFICIVDDGTVRKRQYKLKYSGRLYLVEGMMGLAVLENPGAEPAAEITADGTGLHLTILNEKDYNLSAPIPVDVLGEEIVIVKKYGKKAKITFQAT